MYLSFALNKTNGYNVMYVHTTAMQLKTGVLHHQIILF